MIQIYTVLRFFFKCLFIFERERERQSVSGVVMAGGWGGQREGDRESKAGSGSELSVQSLTRAGTHKP